MRFAGSYYAGIPKRTVQKIKISPIFFSSLYFHKRVIFQFNAK
jgi:hypothetical protein